MKSRLIAILISVILASTYIAALRPENAREIPPAPTATTAPVTSTGFAVVTDYSGLTPYKPKQQIGSRLSKGPMPELVPSDSYGTLLPYVGARVTGEYGGMYDRYGLVTLGGVMVTDAVYSNVYRQSTSGEARSIYTLIGTALGDSEYPLMSACALDGSWCLPFEYDSIYLHESVILAAHENIFTGDIYDLDVYDYSGNLLYNLLDMPYAVELHRGDAYASMLYAECDIVTTRLNSREVVYIDLTSGELTVTDYDGAEQFYGGMSPVQIGKQWGYVDTKLALVIEPQFVQTANFVNGRAIVLLSDGKTYAVINERGEVLFSVESADAMMGLYVHYDGGGYGINGEYYSSDFKPIPTSIDGGIAEYYGQGWYLYRKSDGLLLLSPEGKQYDLPGVSYVNEINGELITYMDLNYNYGVMKLSGETVIPLDEECYYIYRMPYLDLYSVAYPGGERIFNPDGTVFISIKGDARISETKQGLLGILERDCFTYLDKKGDAVFRVSLLAYTID